MVRPRKKTAVIFIVTLTLILVVSCPGSVSRARVAESENMWRARPFFHARPESVRGPDPLSPSQIIGAYNLESTTGGAGATIAIVDAYDDPSVASDLDYFSNYFNLPIATFREQKMATNVGVDGDWALETSLDVEWAHAIAPNATILLVEAKSDMLFDLLDAVSYAASQAGVKAVSMSWGGSEFPTESSFDSYFNDAGITFFASSGDNGSGVAWPSSSPNVVGVGGTTLNLNPDGSVASETAWNDSGGGLSAYEIKPPYQTGYGLAYARRAVPDVSYDADPDTGVRVYDNTSYQDYSGWWNVGGTSAGAPQWAAIQALGLSANNVNFYMDAASSAYSLYFRDITSGSNGYSAGPGYDLVTGLGSPVTTSFTPSNTPDFSLSAVPTMLTVENGTTGTSTITVTALNGFNSTVALSTTPPSGWTASLSQSSIATSGQSTLSVNVPGNASSETYSVTVTGTNGSLDHTIDLTVQVISPVHINADGSVTPVGAPVTTSDNITYSLISNVSYPAYDGINVQRSNVIIDGKGYVIQGNLGEYGLYLASVDNVTISDANVESFDSGIYLESSSNNSLSENDIGNNDYGIYLHYSFNNHISENDIGNNFDGIYLSSSCNNSIARNNVISNDYEGVYLESSSNNSIIENNVADNYYGVYLYVSSDDQVYHNNFIINANQALVNAVNGGNTWDDGYPSGGNYWSDYDGTDLYSGKYQNVPVSDGIGDTPYIIDANNTDSYPLMGPFSTLYSAATQASISCISNSTVSDFQVNGTMMSFNVSGEPGTGGFCTLTIPHSTMPPSYLIEINGDPLSYTTVYEDAAQSVVYFAYENSMHEVMITGATGGGGGCPGRIWLNDVCYCV